MADRSTWVERWEGSPPESSVWEIDALGRRSKKLMVIGNTPEAHAVATCMVQAHNFQIQEIN